MPIEIRRPILPSYRPALAERDLGLVDLSTGLGNASLVACAQRNPHGASRTHEFANQGCALLF
ncbi:hypothetical protein [Sphingomonas sp. NPDC079357]|uniref:hypothetical protein n=1 Tax=Sphingomonas sp. NPDC079357 TaxID=3364518 RepID=UPI00384AD25A